MKGYKIQMNKHIQHLLLFEKLEIQSNLSKKEILKRIESFADADLTDYYGSVSDNGFSVTQKSRKRFAGGYTQNSFAPVASAKIDESEGISSVSVIIRMNMLVLILFAPIYLISLLLIVPFPIMLVVLYFSFMKPAKKLREALENLLKEK